MLHYKILKKFLIPGTALTAVQSEDDSAGGVGSNLKKGLVKPSELPIYADDDCLPRETACPERSGFEETISVVRRELWVFFDAYKGYRQRIVDVVETGKSHAESSLNYMAEESNYLPRLGAISLGGVAGFVYSMRGGTARRILYTAAGSGTIAILCYPRSATAISMEALHAVKKGIVITYNFIHGVKPEGLKLPPLPSTLMIVEKELNPSTPKHDSTLQIVPDNQEERAGATTIKSDQSMPADKDLYTTRR